MGKNMKKIVICGATGLVGSALAEQFHSSGRKLILVGRDAAKLRQAFAFDVEPLTWDELLNSDAENIDVIINLAGASVGDQKWTPTYKQIMRDSRFKTTKKCVELCKKNSDIRLINASAVSAYGFYDQDHAPFSEKDTHKRTGTNFLQEMIDEWEAEALKAESSGNNVTLLRIGVVLDRFGGALPLMTKPYQFYMGGPAGTGKQVMSWIGLRDLVNAIVFLTEHAEISGPVNMVSSGACTQKEFARALGKALNKPSAVNMPTFMIKAAMGQMGEELVLTGQRVSPEKLLQHGFNFQHTDIEVFLKKLYN